MVPVFIMKRNLTHPLLSWDIFLLEQQQLALLEEEKTDLLKLAKDYKWNKSIVAEIHQKFDARKTIVITKPDQIIEWVNSKFQSMTGYSSAEAIGRKPSFLQGEKTCPDAVKKIAVSIQKEQKVVETLVNYRKSGEVYFCKVEIHPVYNSKGLSHFVAFEEEVYQ